MKLVLDTNIVLDLWVFRDESVASLKNAIATREVAWIATPAMREELACVLTYEHMAARMRAGGISADDVLEAFDTHASMVDAAAPAPVKCRDADDQKFVDLAAAHGATLLSKDAQVLALRKKLAVARMFDAPGAAAVSAPR